MDTKKHEDHELERSAAVSKTSRSGFATIEALKSFRTIFSRYALRLVGDNTVALQFLIRGDSRFFADKK